MLDEDPSAERWTSRRAEIVNELVPEIRGSHPDIPDDEFLAMLESMTDAKLLYERFGQDP